MSDQRDVFRNFKHNMNEHIKNGPIGDMERSFRRSIGLDETVSEARRVARGLPPSDSEAILKAIRELSNDAKGSDTRATVYFWVGLGVGVAGLVLGVVGILAGG